METPVTIIPMPEIVKDFEAIKPKKNKGASLTLVIGAYGGFHLRYNKGSMGICLGWIALTFYPYDLENAMSKYFIKEKPPRLNATANQ